jgi:hypothetical protein
MGRFKTNANLLIKPSVMNDFLLIRDWGLHKSFDNDS